MKSILEKFYFVKKYGVAVYLAASSCFSFAMDCNVSKPFQIGGKWYVTVSCYGTVAGEYDVEVEYGGGSGGEGGSTNCGCTAMSPDQCQSIKDGISSRLDTLHNLELPDLTDEKDSIITEFNNLKEILQQTHDKYSEVAEDLYDTGSMFNDMGQTALYEAYSYAGDSVFLNLPDVDSVSDGETYDQLSYIEDKLNSMLEDMTSEINAIGDYVSSMDCSACSGGSGGSDDTGGGSSSGCPCSEVLNAIKEIVDNHYTQIVKIRQFLEKWDKYIKQIATSVNALAFMGTNYTYAVQYRNLDGMTFAMKQLDEKLLSKKSLTFDYQEFGKLTWYSRIEYLLMSIAGVFSKTNREDTLTSSKIDSTYSSITDREDTLKNSVNSIETKFSSLNSAVTGLMTAFSSAVGSGSASGQVTLWASWFGGRGLSMTIPSNVISTSRVVFSLLWTVIFSFTMYQLVLNGWSFIVKFIQFWITQTTGFLK